MNRKSAKRPELDTLRKLVDQDATFRKALEFAMAGVDLVGEGGKRPARLRMPYVSSPLLAERRWK